MFFLPQMFSVLGVRTNSCQYQYCRNTGNHNNCWWRYIADDQFTFWSWQTEGIASYTLATVKGSHAFVAESSTGFAYETSVIIVPFDGLTSGIGWVQLSVLWRIAGQAFPILVAGHAIIGTVRTSRSGLSLYKQVGQAFVKTGVVSSQVISLGTSGTVWWSHTWSALGWTSHTNCISHIIKPIYRNASGICWVKLPFISCWIAW